MEETGASMDVENLPDMTTSISPVATACTAPALIIREGVFNKWLEAAKAGDRTKYHRGHLVVDRINGFSRLHEKRRRELCVIADRAASLADEGRLVLVQRRLDEGEFSYLATKTKQPTRRAA